MSVTPQFIGQRYKDTNTGNIWKANSTTPGDWTLEVQNMQVKWIPRTQKLGELIGFATFTDAIAGTVIFEAAHTVAGFDIEWNTALTSLTFPNLVDCDATGLGIDIEHNSALTTVNFPNLKDPSTFKIVDNGVLISVTAPALASANVTFSVSNNAVLDSVSFPNLIPPFPFPGINIRNNPALTSITLKNPLPEGIYTLDGNALTTSVVDSILASAVANAGFGVGCGIDVSGGTSGAPSSTGPGSDYAILTARFVTLAVNP